MPGMFPFSASSLKHTLQRSKTRIYPLGLPHLKQRRTIRLENLAGFLAFAIIDFFATVDFVTSEASYGTSFPPHICSKII